jgi:hypothetical protein
MPALLMCRDRSVGPRRQFDGSQHCGFEFSDAHSHYLCKVQKKNTVNKISDDIPASSPAQNIGLFMLSEVRSAKYNIFLFPTQSQCTANDGIAASADVECVYSKGRLVLSRPLH